MANIQKLQDWQKIEGIYIKIRLKIDYNKANGLI
jgi:hypothetical protein